jgi:hypothetical protein
MCESYNSLLHQIKRAEADVFLWQCLADKVTNNSNPFLDIDTYAVLFNDKFSYNMKSREVSK